jgi:hypothetical protein
MTAPAAEDRAAAPLDAAEFGCVLWTGLCAGLAAGGYLLGLAGRLASPAGWVAVAAATLVALGGVLRGLRCSLRQRAAPAPAAGPGTRRLAALLVAGFAATALASGLLAFGAAPDNWDALTYHLARAAYYLQQGGLDDFHANFWAQEQQGRLSAILFSGTLVLSGGSDALVGGWQLAAYLVLALEVYQFCRYLGFGPEAAAAAAAAGGLFTVAVGEASTAQNDLLIASFAGAGIIGLVRYLRQSGGARLAYGALGLALAAGTKASSLTLAPSLLLLGGAAALGWLGPCAPGAGRRAARALAAVPVAVLLAAFPAGYIKNWRQSGQPLGRDVVAIHTVAGDQGTPLLERMLLNGSRYAFDFCTCDGLPPGLGGRWGSWLKAAAARRLTRAGLPLDTTRSTRLTFYNDSPASRGAAGIRVAFIAGRRRYANAENAFFGLLGPALLLPAVLLLWRRGQPPALRMLGLAAALFYLVQAAAGPYDPWRGRQFLYATVLLGPLLAALFALRPPGARLYLAVVSALGVASAAAALGAREPNPLLPLGGRPGIFQLDRLGQMAGQSAAGPALRRFQELVPGAATVALALRPNEFEYVLFGPGLTRRLQPVSYTLPHLAVPADCDYLLYDRRLGIAAQAGDADLGYAWSLRRLR